MNGWRLIFYEAESGRRPVQDFLDRLPLTDVDRVTRALGRLERYGLQLGMPHVRAITSSDLWELRVRGKRDFRVLYVAVRGQQFLLLHAFGKKSQQTPIQELRAAERNLEDYQKRLGR